ncbi:MAG: DUF1987 domain-containing protein [Bacteroidales bacterium]|jgi:hypothetical protein|nr:DUF1987 domain-containing protein [Bacteroidales bacterium]HNS31075.1 DUF1987 domain-containing protein [Tenuifilaceae bacterium]MBP8644429.1 DUF1987 domain-containing protein [Bacteroidales bacterium]NLI88460.1 DUF1987 domain-containing protein [Bacteroidales bacterium]HOA09678.1 DUF1987 domain-containing protein [Tenuifilaceae bacterium]
MNSLTIEPTTISPHVSFDMDKGVFIISGYSRPENVRDFYAPIISWLELFRDQLLHEQSEGKPISPIIFNFNLIYFNSSSAKFLYDIVMLLDEVQKKGINLTIKWHYSKDDSELREAGEDLSDMAQVPFDFIEV